MERAGQGEVWFWALVWMVITFSNVNNVSGLIFTILLAGAAKDVPARSISYNHSIKKISGVELRIKKNILNS
ncbi:MAG: hypothetical protein A2270_03590 [Elusimicrobia bacterium RIFOXYA12_FULL_51_18]|nr:MAG: hypothetical protein A2270_03590 [Elusimicrobia bacterium RIFOXYA12_FULL_51_18]OGS31928.1 MAG: hypothetical protein A2218_06555 [Elusimicrobia bacterium RIFOXYA2_FULL_53_38]